MPVPAAAVTRINSFLTNVAGAAATKQAAYFSAQEVVVPAHKDEQGNDVPAVTRTRSRYFQGLRTLSTTPADGTTAAPDRLASKPTDQADSWADLALNLPANLEVNLWVDVYQNRAGWGYMLGVEVWYSGQLWRRTQNFQGTETVRTTPWTDCTPAVGGADAVAGRTR